MFDKKISLKDKELFNKYIYDNYIETSGLSFTSLYMWRDINDIRYDIIKDHLCISALNYLTAEGKPQYFVFPPIPLDKYSSLKLKETLHILDKKFKNNNQNLTIKLAPEEFIPFFKDVNPHKTSIKEDRENFDYAYLQKNLATLKGRKYQSKRNHLNYFYNNTSYEFKPLTKDLLQDCIDLNERILADRPFKGELDKELIEYERIALKEVLFNMDKLSCIGGVILIDNVVEAFTIGGKINPNMMVIHIEKANSNIRGLYAAINQLFVKNQCKDVMFINREEDMGLENLRQAKLSYRPDKMVKKFDIEFK